MKSLLSLVFVFLSLILLSGCVQPHYQYINLSQKGFPSPSVTVHFINKAGAIYITKGGVLTGVTLDTWQAVKATVPLGEFRVSWRYTTLSDKTISAQDSVIITSNTICVVFYPPNQEGMFGYKNRPSIQAHNDMQ